ncbi:hypothetical protein [Thalassovita sp.]|uniref:hypothetical protein n=1 Tax=Thalassovita sp. TaxID=1979401 RepID=UPI0029DE6211|nr:hypothetical protein [Thalassovita sp.]
MTESIRRLISAACLFLAPVGWEGCYAQSYTGSGAGWSSSYGFPSATDRSVGLQTATAIRSAKNPTTSNYYYDYRSGYVEYNAAAGSSMTSDFQFGDTNTSSVGAMNTGDMNVTVEGEGNSVTTTSAAESQGCIDGSIGSALSSMQNTSDISDYLLHGVDANSREGC